MANKSRRLLLVLAPPVVAIYGIHRGLSTLEARYPALMVNDITSSPALRIPDSPSTQHSPHIDIYSARIPIRYLLPSLENQIDANTSSPSSKTNAHLTTAWAKAVFGGRIFRLEGSVFGVFANRIFEPGDIGNTPDGFDPISTELHRKEVSNPSKDRGKEKRKLLHGTLTVERPPSVDSPHGLLVSWKMSDEPRLFFREDCALGIPLAADVWRTA
ncbi:hypothetical protein BDV12DRAFT_80833 [Aspergillus spectabilis]